ncbi:unnamed protein product [Ectocarpus sp. 4 AP-2014]
MVISGHKNKPWFSPAAGSQKGKVDNCKPSAAAVAAVPQASASAPLPKVSPAASGSAGGKLNQDDDVSIESSTAAAKEDGTSEVVAAASAGMPVSEEKTTRTYVASEESISAVTTAVEEEPGQETVAAVQGQLSMMVVAANPRLQEVSALPRGTVVKAKLFVEEEEDESCAPETMEEDTTAAVDVTVGDDLAGTSVVAPAAGGKEDSEQQQQQQRQKDDENMAAEGQPEDVVELPSADVKRDESVVTITTIPEKEKHVTLGASAAIAVSTEPAHMQEERDENLASSLRSEGERQEETRPEDAVVAPDEGQDEQQQVNEAGACTADPAKQRSGDAQAVPQVFMQPASGEEDEQQQHVVLVQEIDAASETTQSASPAHVVMPEEERDEERSRTNDEPTPSVLPQNESDVAPLLPPQEEDPKASVMPSQPDDEADIVPVPQGCAVVTENAPRVVGEPGASGKLEAAADVGLGEERAVAVPGHAGLVVDEETRSLVEGSKYLRFEDDERTVLCTLTGKKLAPDYIGILYYMGSRRVQQVVVEGPVSMSDYDGMFLVEDPADDGFVFCELTGMRMFKSKAAVDQHINGQPFKEMMAMLRAKLES